MPVRPTRAMVLAAGFGTRMRPLTDRMPKPLVPVAGRALLDHVLDKLAEAGVTDAVVNVHYLPDQIIDHTATRTKPRVTISDERDAVLGTGGGVVKALPLLGDAPFYHLNADTLWIDGAQPNLARLAEAFDPTRMDILLLMAPTADSIGYSGSGDYAMLPDGTLRRRKEREVVPFVYAGVAILSPAIFAGSPTDEFALTKLFDRASEQGRLFGLRLDGLWMHVGTPDAVQAAEQAFLASAA
ncbi:MAG: nucleotidyltransferase family protein [Rhizobiales bacterium]|nr:nucleotidyltransferase family protein [Hyphomicrobiales bacterium]